MSDRCSFDSLTAFGHLESRLALLDAVLPLCRLMIVFESLNWTAYSPYVLCYKIYQKRFGEIL